MYIIYVYIYICIYMYLYHINVNKYTYMYVYIYIYMHNMVTHTHERHVYRLDYITSHHSTLHTTLQTLHYIASHSITLPYITQHYTASHHITLHYITSHCIAYTHTQRHIGSEGTGRHRPSRHGCAAPSNQLIFKFCQIWPQPAQAARIQALEEKEAHQICKKSNGFPKWFLEEFTVRLSFLFYLEVPCRFCMLLCHWPWQFSEAAVRRALAEEAKPDVVNHRTIVIRIYSSQYKPHSYTMLHPIL